VDGKVTTSDLSDLIKDGADLQTTVFDFGEAIIQRTTKGDLSIFTISGVYTRALGKEMERLCLQCRGNAGIEFKDIKVNPALHKKFDSSIVGVLKNVRDRYQSKNQLLILCMPPRELIDLLKLTGVYSGYQIVEKPSSSIFDTGISRNSAQTAHPAEEKSSYSEHKTAILQKRILNLNQSLNRTVSLEKGLDSAEKCIKRFLPQSPPLAEGYSFSFSYNSSEKVGGDFFDFIFLGDEAIGILIGDVSGHGIDAALLMGISKKVINLRAKQIGNGSPRQVLCHANADLIGDFHKYAFVTALYGILNLESGNFTFARAGHEMPVLFGPGPFKTIVDSKGIPLATDAGKLFDRMLEEKTMQIQKGASLFLCTDGIAECWNNRGLQYSRERLLFTLGQSKRNLSCREVLDGILQSVNDFASGNPQEDDMTAILLKRLD